MLAKTNTCAVVGLEGFIVQVEVDISPGLPAFIIVGLPDTAVQEAKERVRAAIRNSRLRVPHATRHRQSGPRGPAKSGTRLRPPDCGRRVVGLRPNSRSAMVKA